MKKRTWIIGILLLAMLAAGCANTSSGEKTLVEELPIEQEARTEEAEEGNKEISDMAEGNGADIDSEMAVPQTEKEPYEEIEVEVNGDKGTITVGTTGAPFTEILTQARLLLAKDGWDLQIKKYDDYQKLNEDVVNGTLDAHLFAHQTYIDSYNDVNGTNLMAADRICYEVYGVYSKINQDLTTVNEGVLIGIPEDDTRKARALLFMQDMGWITLKEGVGMTAILEDVAENTRNLQFKEYNQDTLTQVMEEAAYCIIGADMAIYAGLNIEEDMLKKELGTYNSVDVFASLLITSEDNIASEKSEVLVKTLKSEEIKVYLEDAYRGAYEVLK